VSPHNEETEEEEESEEEIGTSEAKQVTDDPARAMRCPLNNGGECLARVPVACLCRQMDETLFRELQDRMLGREHDNDNDHRR